MVGEAVDLHSRQNSTALVNEDTAESVFVTKHKLCKRADVFFWGAATLNDQMDGSASARTAPRRRLCMGYDSVEGLPCSSIQRTSRSSFGVSGRSWSFESGMNHAASLPEIESSVSESLSLM